VAGQLEGRGKRMAGWLTRGRIVLYGALVAVVVCAATLYVGWRPLRRHYGDALVPPATTPAEIQVPSGFHVTIFATGLNAPRFDAVGPDGTLYVADRGNGRIVALLDSRHTGRATQTVVVAAGMQDPTSLAFYHGQLYVGERDKVTRLTLGANHVATGRAMIVPNLPTGGSHVTRTVLVGTDGRLYVSIGSSCDDCVESDPRRAAVMVFNLDGSRGRLYATGLRNAVGMANDPVTGEVWVTNNGRDMLGDNIPPDTIYALQDGGQYGWPRCHAGTIIDPQFGYPGACNGVVQPLVSLQAHSAPLGLAFYPRGVKHSGAASDTFPIQWRGLFVAFHGSWNRTIPTGYKVVFIPLNSAGHVAGPVRDFAAGWLHADGTASGRPVGIAVGQDGALYVTDDQTGQVYRISYGG
jgi:glucose/arabinose dehydrogenase